MPWSRSRPGGRGHVDPKYRSPEHLATRKAYTAQLHHDGYLTCAQPECVMRSRTILPHMRWHLGHDDTGTRVIGPTHMRCNVRDGAKRARARQEATRLRW